MGVSRPGLLPRIGFLGLGWIGTHRLRGLAGSGQAVAQALADPSGEALARAAKVAPDARLVRGLDEILDEDLDGLVISTPSAMHAEQAVRALERGLSVFCQKPLARTAAETRRILEVARGRDRLLAVDLSYRFAVAFEAVRACVAAGDVGEVYAAELEFHNAYGPDRAWFYDPALAGGGCAIDLGIHLVDYALWTLDWPEVERADARLYAQGRPLGSDPPEVEDHALARLELAGGRTVEIRTSWNLSLGRDAGIAATFWGTSGAAAVRNVGGSFFDFEAFLWRRTHERRLVSPPDDWGPRAVVAWAERLGRDPRYDPAADRLLDVALVLDRIYGRSRATPRR